MIGLLWFDDSPQRSLKEKVEQAARRYTEKFGRYPNVCYVHPSMLDGDGGSGQALVLELGDVSRRGCPLRLTVRPRRTVLRHHLWVGEEE
ncbi:MAG: hypothetical protein NZ769_04580 [Anaerolineae bacterium]|nr:hypothetical protein [Anaerolineae bacterium]MCX8068865.1 hypothetical protein [Anaerolineae bacterium]